MLYKIPRFCNTRSFQIQANIEIFNTPICKLMHPFVERCRQSAKSHVTALIHSASHFCLKYYAYYRNFLTLDNIQGVHKVLDNLKNLLILQLTLEMSEMFK